MKVAWFTPFNKESAIGRYSKLAGEALSKFVEVEFFVYRDMENSENNVLMHDSYLCVHYYSNSKVVEQLNSYDICVYNMGDNVKYHAIIYEVMNMHPGLLIQHDICMHNFMRGYYVAHKKDAEKYESLLRQYYGEAAKDIIKAGNSAEKWSEIDFLKYSFSEHIYDKAAGVIVHSDYHHNIMNKYYHGPVLVTPILDLKEWAEIDETRVFTGYDRTKINILTVGVVNPNKHIDTVIEVLGKNPHLKREINYTIIGSLENEQYINKLKNMINKYELNDSVKLLGFVNHDSLSYYYHYADFISNLRYPAFEGGSGSLVEQMAVGKGIIVTDTGVYSEIPEDCICKVSPKNMVEDLTKVFDEFLQNRELVQKYANNAKSYADVHFNRELYAERVSKFIEEVTFTLPLYEVLDKCSSSVRCMNNTKIKKILADEMEGMYY